MGDPREGLTPDGLIRTGAAAGRIGASYRTILDAAVESVISHEPAAAVYLYGSVANGTARIPRSDVDLLTIGLDAERAREISSALSSDFAHVCRSVDIGAAAPDDLVGEHDEAYGGRVFLHHYCILLAGPDHDHATTGFPGDRRAARGFNGDIAQHLRRWREERIDAEPEELGRKAARKTLLAVAGLVSVHDAIWTTDRAVAALRWSEVHPDLTGGLTTLLGWAAERSVAGADALAETLDATVDPIVDQFRSTVGLWDEGVPET